jgi:hypothetical protein
VLGLTGLGLSRAQRHLVQQARLGFASQDAGNI